MNAWPRITIDAACSVFSSRIGRMLPSIHVVGLDTVVRTLAGVVLSVGRQVLERRYQRTASRITSGGNRNQRTQKPEHQTYETARQIALRRSDRRWS